MKFLYRTPDGTPDAAFPDIIDTEKFDFPGKIYLPKVHGELFTKWLFTKKNLS